MTLPASFFSFFANEPIALLALVIAEFAPAYFALMAFSSSIVEACCIAAMPSAMSLDTASASNTMPSATRTLSYIVHTYAKPCCDNRESRIIPTVYRLPIVSIRLDMANVVSITAALVPRLSDSAFP